MRILLHSLWALSFLVGGALSLSADVGGPSGSQDKREACHCRARGGDCLFGQGGDCEVSCPWGTCTCTAGGCRFGFPTRASCECSGPDSLEVGSPGVEESASPTALQEGGA